jgi:hypothetical protein
MALDIEGSMNIKTKPKTKKEKRKMKAINYLKGKVLQLLTDGTAARVSVFGLLFLSAWYAYVGFFYGIQPDFVDKVVIPIF